MRSFRILLALCCLVALTAEGAHAQKRTKPAKSKYEAPVCKAVPKVGTSFINTYYLLDSTGKRVPTSVEDPKIPDDSQYVIFSEPKFEGHSNVIGFTNAYHEDTTYTSYDPNGDVWIKSKRRGEHWEHLPFGMTPHKPLKTKEVVDTGSVLGTGYSVLSYKETEVLGWDSLALMGKMYPCVRLRIVMHTRYDPDRHPGLAKERYANAMNYWYVPQLGYFGKISFGWGGTYFLVQEIKSYKPA